MRAGHRHGGEVGGCSSGVVCENHRVGSDLSDTRIHTSSKHPLGEPSEAIHFNLSPTVSTTSSDTTSSTFSWLRATQTMYWLFCSFTTHVGGRDDVMIAGIVLYAICWTQGVCGDRAHHRFNLVDQVCSTNDLSRRFSGAHDTCHRRFIAPFYFWGYATHNG